MHRINLDDLLLNGVLDQLLRDRASPTSATLGAIETISVNWFGLDADTKYLGAVSHSDAGGVLDLTLIAIDTDQRSLFDRTTLSTKLGWQIFCQPNLNRFENKNSVIYRLVSLEPVDLDSRKRLF